MDIAGYLARIARRFGYDVHRLDAVRRSQLLRHHGVDLVLDVGAAIGKYGIELRRFGYNGRIVSFEPLDGSFAALAKEAEGDPSWTAVNCAVGDSNRTSVIHIAGNNDSSSLLEMLDRHSDVAPHARYVGSQEVDVRTLDDLTTDLFDVATVPFLKIDTQGFERAVLDGAVETLPRLRGVQLEMSLAPLYEGGMLMDEAIQRLLAAGFELQGLELGLRDPRTQQLLQADGIFFRNHPRPEANADR
jgi:FkbM family methyltransferase